jgi:heme/copper-type cytochrome/quinol oxidase subunit 2
MTFHTSSISSYCLYFYWRTTTLIRVISNLGSNLVFSEIEYFTYLNLWLVSLLVLLVIFFLLLSSSLLTIVSIYLNAAWMEFFLTLFSLWFLWLIISPSLIILLEFDLILIPSFIIYSLGYQWAWSFNLSFTLCFLKVLAANSIKIGICSFDHYIISSFFLTPLFSANSLQSSLNCSSYFISYSTFAWSVTGYWTLRYSFFFLVFSGFKLLNLITSHCFPFYLFDINRFLIIPLWTSFKIIVFSFDVIHSLGFYCFGIKIDAIPARINLGSTLRSLFKGEHRGFCFELCGQGHSSMLIVGLIIILFSYRFESRRSRYFWFCFLFWVFLIVFSCSLFPLFLVLVYLAR